jgi:hypothetical protein
MGRSLKISKYSPGSGDTTTNGVGVIVDVAYPPFSALTDPDTGSGTGLTTDQFLGVVGGFQEGQGSATYPYISCTVNIVLNNGTNTTAVTGRILRQKGAHKFLVAAAVDINDEDIVAGNTYMINSASATNWAQFGAGPNAAQGDIFTATINGSAAVVNNGTVWDVGQCVLQNSATPTAGFMSVGYTFNGGSVTYASYITNKWVRDWNGMTYGNYSDSNLGQNNYTNENYYVTNFFSNVGTVTLSGADVINSAPANNGSVYIAQVDNLTS